MPDWVTQLPKPVIWGALVLLLVALVACLILIAALIYGAVIVVTPLVAILVGAEGSTARAIAIVLVAATTIVTLTMVVLRHMGFKGV